MPTHSTTKRMFMYTQLNETSLLLYNESITWCTQKLLHIRQLFMKHIYNWFK